MKGLQALVIIPVIALAVAGPAVVQASGHQFTRIDAPKAGTGPGEGTALSGSNQRGDIVGAYVDGKGVTHGFVLRQGRYTTVDYPGAKVHFTQVMAINEQGDIVGSYADGTVAHGFLRQQGQYVTLQYPRAGTIGLMFANGINTHGDIVGSYYDDMHVSHGYLFHQGRYTTLDDPKAGSDSADMGTYPIGINQQGDIVGSYVDRAGAHHGFLLRQGRSTTLDAPRAASAKGTACAGSAASGINRQGDIVGCYADRNLVLHGFLLHQGKYTVLDDPSAAKVHGPGEETQAGTIALGISERGAVVGTYVDSQGVSHGFLWQ